MGVVAAARTVGDQSAVYYLPDDGPLLAATDEPWHPDGFSTMGTHPVLAPNDDGDAFVVAASGLYLMTFSPSIYCSSTTDEEPEDPEDAAGTVTYGLDGDLADTGSAFYLVPTVAAVPVVAGLLFRLPPAPATPFFLNAGDTLRPVMVSENLTAGTVQPLLASVITATRLG